jgi:hypothetical protein
MQVDAWVMPEDKQEAIPYTNVISASNWPWA